MSGAGAELQVRRAGSGPRLVLVHGGVGPAPTWERQEELSARWSLVIPYRRGFGSSPPAHRQDFERDAEDIRELLESGAHLAGFSYGGLGAAIAAGLSPAQVRSLTLIEPPLFGVGRGDPEVEDLVRLSEGFIVDTQGTNPDRAAFLELAGLADREETHEAIAEVDAQVGRLRSPLEADPDLGSIVRAGIPVTVASGGHNDGIEKLCDLLADRLEAQRLVVPGAGHPAQRAEGFNREFERFLTDAEGAR